MGERKGRKSGIRCLDVVEDGSQTDDGRVGAMALYINGDGWTVYHSYLGKGGMEVLDAELWPFGIVLRKS